MTKVAVYGSLRKGMGNHVLLEGSKFLGNDVVQGSMYSLGGFPGCHNHDPEDTIHIEVYEVDDDTLQSLDWLEGVDEECPEAGMYRRERIFTSLGSVYIYWYNGDVDAVHDYVEGGDWVKYYNSERSKDYTFYGTYDKENIA